MSSNDATFGNIGCKLGGLTLNGNVIQGTANSLSVLTINDPSVIIDPTIVDTSGSVLVGYFQVTVGNNGTPPQGQIDFTKPFYIPLYQ